MYKFIKKLVCLICIGMGANSQSVKKGWNIACFIILGGAIASLLIGGANALGIWLLVLITPFSLTGVIIANTVGSVGKEQYLYWAKKYPVELKDVLGGMFLNSLMTLVVVIITGSITGSPDDFIWLATISIIMIWCIAYSYGKKERI